MKFLSYLTLLLLLPQLLSAADFKIVHIRDSNLFELDNGSLVRLANVKVPSVSTADSNFIYLARFIKKYAEAEYLKWPVSIEYSGKRDSSGYALAHIFQFYPFETIHINAVYLKKGFGWYRESPGDTTYRNLYKAAARYAEQNKKGVWNPLSFKSAGFSDYAASAFYGYFKPRDTQYKTSIHEITLRFAPAKEMSGLEAKASVYFKREQGRICCDCPGEAYIPPYTTETSIVYILSGVFQRTFKWTGFSLGMTYLNSKDTRCSEGMEYFVFPSATVKAGLMEKVYVSFSLWDYFRMSEYTTGITYIFNNPFNRLWIGFGSYSDYKNRTFQLDYNFYKNYLLQVQGGCLLKEKTEVYGRIGFGFILH